ncbi:uncharacterized protein TRUGW13939_05128 [Talaromyces rugulosus]|uniref:Uncharacterized protein n=1 Tax=Talaromyces rugulosus TaxID=121627 RepID=A0A7H8QWG0_TALRU|nr:uncharacterized protein TRUGW13939_05128 [Talaromyces rugulosus]QKX58008.1 hypothetical protein TRUGW13939_05128 [Talaromyces rugulosus]
MAEDRDQLDDYAFTTRGHAYAIDDLYKSRDRPEILTARKLSSVTWKARQKTVPPPINKQAENKPPGRDEVQVLFVGLFPPTAHEETLTKKLAIKGPVGHALPKDVGYVVQSMQGQPAFRVVVVNKSTIPEGGLKYFVLFEKDHTSGLWNGFTISQELIFFFPEYRHPTKTLSERGKDWSQKVLTACSGGHDTRAEGVAHHTYLGTQNDHQIARLHLEMAKFHLTQNPESLDAIEEMVNNNDRPTSQLKSLVELLLAVDGDFDETHADALTTEVRRHWNGLDSVVSSDGLLSLNKGIVENGHEIDTKYAYVFIALGCTMFASGSSSKQSVVCSALMLAKTLVSKGEDFDFAIPPTQKTLVKDIFVALLTKIKPLYQSMTETQRRLERQHGKSVLRFDPREIYDHIMQARDQDTLWLLIDQLVAIRSVHVMEAMSQHVSAVASIRDYLKEFLATLNEADEEDEEDEAEDEEDMDGTD